MLRHMQKDDLREVNSVLSRAFTHARWEQGLQAYRVPPCCMRFLEMYLQRFPQGSFVLHDRRRIRGFIFAHLWGKIGWVGPLAVLPDWQGRGYGRDLLEASLQTLIDAGAATLGLESAPLSFRNIGFYGRKRFFPGYLTVDLSSEVKRSQLIRLSAGYRAEALRELSGDAQNRAMSTLDRLANRLDPNLRLTREVALLHRFDYGDAWVLYRGEEPVGFAVGHTERYYEEEKRRFLKVYLGGLTASDWQRDLDAYLNMLAQWTRQAKLKYMIVRISTRQRQAFQALLGKGFKPIHGDLRFVLEGFEEQSRPDDFYLNKWE
ncbi:MAG: GNAT family N-acetyltransferase [candidate division KSB1 bacterium]|nr:GNAT family N-acetyltransferase [candidate division KSB1 bacterium]MDQ7065691.1 GNAT family N-acetyltransferase [candidate division KSB1 bacterium]